MLAQVKKMLKSSMLMNLESRDIVTEVTKRDPRIPMNHAKIIAPC